MAVRTVVQIDEDKCDGCGLCVPGCAEGALKIVDGKAKLVSDVYCDGLGECLGECPRGAITLVEREAEEYDEKAVSDRLTELGRDLVSHDQAPQPPGKETTCGTAGGISLDKLACGCPGTLAKKLDRPGGLAPDGALSSGGGSAAPSMLGNWPVQIMLVPPHAPYLQGADLVIAADCVPFAYGDFHRKFLPGKILLVGCPKFDDVNAYIEKLAAIFRDRDIRSIDVVHMEVPCCNGLIQLVKKAIDESGRRIPTTLFKVGIKGDFVEERVLPGAAA